MANILISVGNASIRRYLAMALELKGHQVFKAESDEQAKEMIRAIKLDLLLIDVVMPQAGGYQLVRRLRMEFGTQLPSVIFLASPYMESEARLLADACGVSQVITKVTDSDALLAAVAAALSEPPARRADAPGGNDSGNGLHRIVNSLYGRVAELKMINARLGHNAATGAAQLEVARSALKREVIKRLRTERDMTLENQRLRAQSVRDPLTGLYNRRYLEESLAREESRAKRSGKPLSMMMIDIDNFQRCNDTFGHEAGDAVLREVSRCMESNARSEDILCRYGSEEFVLLMANTAPNILLQRADALRSAMPKLGIEYEHRPIGPITLSIGLASFPDQGNSVPAVLQAADTALNQAKLSGRNRIVVGSSGVLH